MIDMSHITDEIEKLQKALSVGITSPITRDFLKFLAMTGNKAAQTEMTMSKFSYYAGVSVGGSVITVESLEETLKLVTFDIP